MPHSGSKVRVDTVDGPIWFETAGTEQALVSLHALLDRSRMTPRPWMPFVVLTGAEGSGKTALARRFMLQAQRAATCVLFDRAREARNAPLQLLSSEARQSRERERADARARSKDYRRQVHDFGHCPRVCAPAVFARPVEDLAATIHASMHGDGRREDLRDRQFRYDLEWASEVEPAVMSANDRRVGSSTWISRHVLAALPDSPGNRGDDAMRRTSMVFVDRADRLLELSPRERGSVLQDIKDLPRPVTVVLVGSQALVEAVQAEGKTQTIGIPPLEGGEFEEVVRLVFGERDPDDVGRLHAASGGAMGPLLHIAGLQGLKPPYAVPDERILRLPAPS